VDIRDIQRLHEQFAHAPLTIEAQTTSNNPAGRLLPLPAFAAASATRRWVGRAGNTRQVASIVVGIVAAGALGMSIANWQHGRTTDAAKPETAAPVKAEGTQDAPELGQAPVVAIAAASSPATTDTAPMNRAAYGAAQSIEIPAKGAELVQQVAQPPAAVIAPVSRLQPSQAPVARATPPVVRKVEPAPAQANAAPQSPPAHRPNAASEIKLF
jgi:hypothetical protein